MALFAPDYLCRVSCSIRNRAWPHQGRRERKCCLSTGQRPTKEKSFKKKWRGEYAKPNINLFFGRPYSILVYLMGKLSKILCKIYDFK